MLATLKDSGTGLSLMDVLILCLENRMMACVELNRNTAADTFS